ncbi:MAG: hypothetical protein K8F91_25025 [Candidatus Obscuribacterales bacterium]|nr:hypothetical protein [Candidatus Obscuribacterales bacterium]
MVEEVEVKEKFSHGKSRIPVRSCLLIVILVTASAFLFFGGANYIQNQHEIDSRYWRRAADAHNWMQWAFYFFETGVMAGLLGFVGSTATVIAINWPWVKRDQEKMS